MYPTVSEQTTPIANLDIEPAQTSIANYQAACFSQVCNVYAPMYRQVTIPRSSVAVPATVTPEEREAGYTDVLNAWNEFRGEPAARFLS